VQRLPVIAALASAVLLGFSSPAAIAQTTAAPAIPTSPPARSTAPAVLMTSVPERMTAAPALVGLALDGRNLRARRTASGYTVSGQALVKDACQAARFDRIHGNLFPPQLYLSQVRRPGTMGMMCIQRLTWVTAPALLVPSKALPNSITVQTTKRSYRVPVK